MAFANETASAGTAAVGFPGDTSLWIGEHAGDGDLLVFDPELADAGAENLAFFSLKQLRVRAFPRTIIGQRIHEVTDEQRAEQARTDYLSREDLRADRERDQETAREAKLERQRSGVVDLHRRYLESKGIEYAGVTPLDANRKPRRRANCHWCGIALDDFSGAACVTCAAVLCSCGACSCGGKKKAR